MLDSPTWDVAKIRSRFPALRREQDGQPVVFLDGPAGSQVPQSVADTVSEYLLTTNSNRGAASTTARLSDELLDNAHSVFADFLGATDSTTIFFGANMTSITFAVSRALSKRWGPGDEIIVTRLDHDANVTPWILAARDAGVTVHHIELQPDDWSLDLEDFESKLSNRTKLVAVGYASNATGTINPVSDIIAAAKQVDALTYVDAVHYAPHGRISVEQLNCDFLVCSAYKFCGTHVGVACGRRELLEDCRPYKLRPSPDTIPGRWMNGTQNHEGIAGAAAAVEYFASLDDADSDRNDCSDSIDMGRRAKLDRVFSRIKAYESHLSEQFLTAVRSISGVTIHGINDSGRLNLRVPTFSMTHETHSTHELAIGLAEQGIFAWSGNHYALPFTEAAGLEPDGTLRIGALHYNTSEEIQRVADCLRKLIG